MNQLQSHLRSFKYKPLVYKIVTYSVFHSSESPLSWDSQCKSLASSASQYHLQIPEKQITEHSYNTSIYRLKSYQWRTQEFFSGGVQQIQLRTEERENGDLGVVAP